MSDMEKSFEEKQAIVQDNLISVINDSISSPIVRFLKPEERTMTEEEMQKVFEIYNGFTFITHYSKKSRKTEYQIRMGMYFSDFVLDMNLEPDVYRNLKSWVRGASIALDKYFANRYDSLYIGRLRFDFLTLDRANFIIPDFRLETNIFLYKNLVLANSSHYTDYPETETARIPYEEFVNSEWSDILSEQAFRERK